MCSGSLNSRAKDESHCPGSNVPKASGGLPVTVNHTVDEIGKDAVERIPDHSILD